MGVCVCVFLNTFIFDAFQAANNCISSINFFIRTKDDEADGTIHLITTKLMEFCHKILVYKIIANNGYWWPSERYNRVVMRRTEFVYGWCVLCAVRCVCVGCSKCGVRAVARGCVGWQNYACSKGG